MQTEALEYSHKEFKKRFIGNPQTETGDVFDFLESPSSEYVIYLATRPEAELFSVRLITEELEATQLCFPITSKNDDITIICL